jgi:hypothetical protein
VLQIPISDRNIVDLNIIDAWEVERKRSHFEFVFAIGCSRVNQC